MEMELVGKKGIQPSGGLFFYDLWLARLPGVNWDRPNRSMPEPEDLKNQKCERELFPFPGHSRVKRVPKWWGFWMSMSVSLYKLKGWRWKINNIWQIFNAIEFIESKRKQLWSKKAYGIGDCIDGVCLLLHGQVSRQPKTCHSAILPCLTQRVEHFVVFQVLYGIKRSIWLVEMVLEIFE